MEISEWALETRRKTLTTLTDSLKQLVTLDAGLIAGAVALLNFMHLWPWVAAITVLFLLASLAAALCGAMPLTGNFVYNEDAMEARDKGIAWRSRCLWLAGALLFGAFLALVLLGVLPSVFGYGPPAAK